MPDESTYYYGRRITEIHLFIRVHILRRLGTLKCHTREEVSCFSCKRYGRSFSAVVVTVTGCFVVVYPVSL